MLQLAFPRRLLFVLATFLLVALYAERSEAYRIHVYPDSIFVSAQTGTTSGGAFVITDGRDTTLGPDPRGYVHYRISGSSYFHLSDSSRSFFGVTEVPFTFSPEASGYFYATLLVESDSSTIYVPIVGWAFGARDITIEGATFDSLRVNHTICHDYTISNPNPYAVEITAVSITDDPEPGTQFSYSSLPTLPFSIAAHSHQTFTVCAALGVGDTSRYLNGLLSVTFESDSSALKAITHELTGWLIPISDRCIEFDETLTLGHVAEGHGASHTFHLDNLTDSTVFIDSASFYGGSTDMFSFASGTFPFSIAGHTAHDVGFHVAMPSPALEDTYLAYFHLYARGMSDDGVACGLFSAAVGAELDIPITDTITLDVPMTDSSHMSALHFTVNASKTAHLIRLHNTGSTNILVTELSILDSGHHATFQGGGTTIYPTDTITSSTDYSHLLFLEVTDTGEYNFDIQVSYRNSLTTQVYHVAVHRIPSTQQAAVAAPSNDAFNISLAPNPATDHLNIDLGTSAHASVEIFDILGNLIWRGEGARSLRWDGMNLQGIRVSAGAYIIRATIHDENGRTFTQSRRALMAE